MQFTDAFIKKYSDPEKHASMQDVINNAYEAVNSINASQEHKELVFETLYAFKHTIAERANINMADIYKKVELINSIGFEEYDRELNAAGLCYPTRGTDKRPIEITINDKYESDRTDYPKVVGIHEILHGLSADYYSTIDKNIVVNIGLKGSAAEETVNDACTSELAKFLEYDVGFYNNKITTRDGDAGYYAYSTANVAGYVRIGEYNKLMEATYGAEILYKDKFTHQESIAARYGEAHYKFIADTLERIQNGDNSIDEHLKLERAFLPVLETRWKSNYDYNISNYIADCQKIQSATVNFFINGDNGQPLRMDAMTAHQNAFEIIHIYATMREIDDTIDLMKELNPATRSQDCQNFLIAMNGLKNLDKTYSDDELWDMQYKRINSKNGSVIELTIGEDKYRITGEVDRATGLTSFEAISSFEESIMAKFKLGGIFRNSELTRLDSISVDFTDMAEVNRYTNIYDKMLTIINDYQVPTSYHDAVTFMCATNHEFEPGEIKTLLSVVDIGEIHDSNGNNIFHILAKNHSSNAANILHIANELYPEQTGRLLNTPNNNGLTPMDVTHDYGNFSVLCETYNSRLPDFSIHRIHGNQYLMGESRYISIEQQIMSTRHVGFISKMVESGMDVNARDYNGNTIMHMYARGELEGLSLHQMLNKGANINILNQDGESPINIAVSWLNIETTEKLLKFGANPNCVCELLEDPRANAFNHAKRMEILDILLDAGANPNAATNIYGYTPLQIAADMEHANNPIDFRGVDYDAIKSLIEAGADPFHETRSGESLRDFAARTGDARIFDIMISAGIDIEALNVRDSNLSMGEVIALERNSTTVDMDLMDKIRQHQIEESNNRTQDLDLVAGKFNDDRVIVAGEDVGMSLDD